ncbi:Uncharacterised protein [Mycobacteroides abscessus subsp. abscessus]|nr:Uncharacterised protein [Mycobacteroides abscessus subsp. abscessus]
MHRDGRRFPRGKIVQTRDRDEIRCDRPLHKIHAVAALAQVEVVAPVIVVAIRQVSPVVIQAPPRLSARQR